MERQCKSLLALVLLGLPSTLWAWGATGHKVVGLIAEDRLTPAAREEVARILGPDQDLEKVAMWADNLRRSVPEERWKVMGRWHYINLDVRQEETLFGWEKSCPNGDCVTARVEKDLATLRSRFSDQGQRRNALRFLVHFVGDLHQPLHCGDDGDEGGNDKYFKVSLPGGRRSKWVNLHEHWDKLMTLGRQEAPGPLARKLLRGLSEGKAKAWSKGTPKDWVFESYKVAKQRLYRDLPPGPMNLPPEERAKGRWGNNQWGKELPPEYASGEMRALAEEQLQKAGVRLAFLLNEIFKD